MKKYIVSVLLALVAGVLSGCGHKHQWREATCIEPMTCMECGETKGEPQKWHDWESATCTAPRTCRICGETEGEALGHEFLALDWSGKCFRCEEQIGISLDVTNYEEYIEVSYIIKDGQVCYRFEPKVNGEFHEVKLWNVKRNWVYAVDEAGYTLGGGRTSLAVGGSDGDAYWPTEWAMENVLEIVDVQGFVIID